MNLAFLSIARVGRTFWRHRKVPHVPSNTERLQAWRQFAPVQFANTHFSPSRPPHQPTPNGAAALSFKESQ